MTDLLRTLPELPAVLENLFTIHSESETETLLAALLPTVCDVLKTDRCFLLVRNPDTRMHKNLCWRREPEYPDTSTAGWESEQEWEREDPLFAAALRAEDSIFINDVETADPTILNREFERKYLKHRSFIHAHIRQDGQLWGILQPCLFHQPREWSEADRLLINQLTERLAPIVVQYVKAAEV